MVDQVLGVGVESDPLRRGDGLPFVDEAGDERPEIGTFADVSVGETREGADRVRGGVEDDLAPLCRTRVCDGAGRHTASRAGVRERSTCSIDGGGRLERRERRVTLHVPLHVPRFEQLAGRKRRPANHRPTCRASVSSFPTPFMTERRHRARKRMGRRRNRRLRRAWPWSPRCRSRRAAGRPHRSSPAAGLKPLPLPRAGDRTALIASTWAW